MKKPTTVHCVFITISFINGYYFVCQDSEGDVLVAPGPSQCSWPQVSLGRFPCKYMSAQVPGRAYKHCGEFEILKPSYQHSKVHREVLKQKNTHFPCLLQRLFK